AALASAALSNHALVLRATLLFLKRSIEGGLATMPLVKLLGFQLLDLGDCDRILLICGTKPAHLISRGAISPSTVDSVFSRGLDAKISSLNLDEGVLQLTDLGGQFLPALADWFGVPPKRLIFLRTRAILDENEENLIFVLPVRSRIRLIGMDRIFRSVVCASTLVRSSLAATRSRFLSSDILLDAQNSVAEREQELGQMVHLVNNIAQDISIQCESIAGALSDSKESPAAKRVELLEVLARNLSAGVSDIKLQRELLRLGDVDRSDQVDVEVLIEELRVYARYREHRRGDVFEIQNFVPVGTAVRIASREFLETGLRLLLRIRASKMAQGARTRVEANVRNDMVSILISDSGKPDAEVSAIGGLDSRVEQTSEQREAQYFLTIAKLAEQSAGSLRVVPPPAQFSNSIELTLPVARSSGSMHIEAGQWALLVDDNAQVTTFYSRVAEALSLKYASAASVAEAERMIEERGRPRIVITDIQLGTGSGLDLVRTLRRKFGGELPVIVVSGHTADALADEVNAAGATKYLTKPVGRAKLFAEIRSLLSAP
ncbi:MAG: response regulator, partial [Deltaproteobacteria bacterium]|nr:response regulator [Deltaproteobacteria bacterium]